jgi:hypothetical protein
MVVPQQEQQREHRGRAVMAGTAESFLKGQAQWVALSTEDKIKHTKNLIMKNGSNEYYRASLRALRRQLKEEGK